MKYKSIILILSIFILFSIASVSAGEVDDKLMMSDENPEIESTSIEKDLKTTDDNKVLSKTNDEEIQKVIDNEIIGEDIDQNTNATFEDLRDEIGQGGIITLTHKLYTAGPSSDYAIEIYGENSVIDGNGTVLDLNNTINTAFIFYNKNITIKNLTIKNGNYESGSNGALIYINYEDGKILDCNFIDNRRDCGAIIIGGDNCAVTNCTFINNTAGIDFAGAISTECRNITVTNCYFSGNFGYGSSDIYSLNYPVTADTCIFKDAGATYNVDIVPPTLNVDDFTTFYGSGEKLTFDLQTNSSIPVTNGNISISVYFKDNGEWVRNYTCLSGEGWIPDLPVGSYIAFFDTEYAEFQPINRTINIIPNIPYYVNITSITTNNKTVNITAKSNMPQDIIQGKLLFILTDSTVINATYASNGTWWAVHPFDDYKDYQVNASYIGLDNVTITNATISIVKANSTVNVSDVVMDWRNSTNVTVTAEGTKGINATIDNKPVTVINNYTIVIPDLAAGNYTLTVTTIPDDNHKSVNKTVKVTVNKVDSTLTVNNMTFDYKSTGSTNVSFTGATGVNASVVNQPKATVNVNNSTITVSGLDAGTYTLTVTTIADANHTAVTKTATITVNKLKTQTAASAVTTTYNINKDLVITLKDSNGNSLSGVKITVDLNGAKTYTTDKNGQVKVATKGLAAKSYTAKITFNGDTNYEKSTKDVKVTVKKATPKITAKKKTFKAKTKTKKYTITLKDNNGKAMKKVKVTLKVKGKTYKAKTNSKGKTTFKIKNLKKKGKYTAVIKYKGDKNYNKVTKKVKLTVKSK